MTDLAPMDVREGGQGPPPVVSIVIPAYDAERHIAASLKSISAQTFENFEVLVVDDCSRDGTAALVEKLARADPRIRLIRLARNCGGPAGPRNVGVREARGKWIAFLDSDDIWHPDKLRVQLNILRQTGAQFCSSKMVNFEDADKLTFEPAARVRTRNMRFLSLLIKPRVPTSSVVVAAELVRRHPFNESMLYRAREDFDCWLHCHEEIKHSPKIEHALVGYRVSPQQISGNKLKMLRRHFHVLKEYRFRSGARLGIGAVPLTLTHFALSFYFRMLRSEL